VPKRSVTVEAEGGVKISALAKQHEDELYVFAVNYDERLVDTKVSFAVDGLPAGKEVAVVDEARTIRPGAGWFTDSFEPLDVHIYRIAVE